MVQCNKNAADAIDPVETQIHPSIVQALAKLDHAIRDFKKHYDLFKAKHELVSIVDDVQIAVERAGADNDIQRSAQLFEIEISTTMQVWQRKQELANSTWIGKLGKFLTKLYPLARLSLLLTGAIAEVNSRLQ